MMRTMKTIDKTIKSTLFYVFIKFELQLRVFRVNDKKRRQMYRLLIDCIFKQRLSRRSFAIELSFDTKIKIKTKTKTDLNVLLIKLGFASNSSQLRGEWSPIRRVYNLKSKILFAICMKIQIICLSSDVKSVRPLLEFPFDFIFVSQLLSIYWKT